METRTLGRAIGTTRSVGTVSPVVANASMGRGPQLARRVAALLAVVVVLLLSGAGTAAAHNTLVSASPADGSSVRSGPSLVRLEFNLPVEQGFCLLTVLGVDGSHWEAGPPTIDGSSVSAPVRPLGPAGNYRIEYRIISADGHPVSGSTRFTLTQAGSGTPAAAPAAANASVDAAPSTTDFGVWPWLAGAGLILAGAAIVGWRVSRA